jgi:uncharacterized protein (DUF2147 family)
MESGFTIWLKGAVMKKLAIIAALLLASTAANAGNSISLEIDGHRIRIEVPANCDQLSCLKISAPDFGFKGFKSARNDADDVAPRADPPAQKPAPAEATTPQPSATPANTPSTPAIASTAPTIASTAPATPAPAVKDDAAPAAPTTAATAAPKATAAAAAPVQTPVNPLGVWTVENRGTVRIEACGQNLCGYAVKTGEKVLIDMKPSDAKWTGQIRDPDTGRTYDSNIAMMGPNSLRVEGCAFGGMFCGGQTWNRVS